MDFVVSNVGFDFDDRNGNRKSNKVSNEYAKKVKMHTVRDISLIC